jgi:carboxymethylenebutenolidase
LLGEGAWLRCIRVTFKAFQARAGKPFELDRVLPQQLRADRDCTGKVGVIGFCMGGGFALLLSAQGYHAASVNYGPVPPDIGELAARSCPIVASYGGRDWTTRACRRCAKPCVLTTYRTMSRSIQRPATAS